MERKPPVGGPRGSRERGTRAGHTPVLRRDAPEPIEKVAPWRDWTPVALRASSGGAYPYRVHFTVSGLEPEQNARYSKLITSAAYKYFKIEGPPREGEGPSAYLIDGEWLRVVYDELIVQFEPLVSSARRIAIVEETGFRVIEPSYVVKDQWIVRHARPGVAGESLLEAADTFGRYAEVEFAWPNSVAEYRRASGTTIPHAHRWWLDKINVNWSTGTRRLPKGEATVVIAVLDDGVDIGHPNLVNRVVAGLGKDFAFLPSEAEHSDPRPKVQLASGADSDYHGTLCAGVICSDGSETGFLGVAPGCRLIPVRVIDGPNLIGDSRVANAITYATGVADVISCSWGGPLHATVVKAINDTILGRGGKGSLFVGSSGNEGKSTVSFPARHSRAIAIGACGPNDQVTQYANTGDELAAVAPSSMNNAKVYSTDVSQEGWGYNTGNRADAAGLFSNAFGKTSAAAAMTAGVAGLCLSANPDLTAAELRDVLRTTAEKVVGNNVPPVVYTQGRSPQFGYGCIDAAAAYEQAKDMLGPQPTR